MPKHTGSVETIPRQYLKHIIFTHKAINQHFKNKHSSSYLFYNVAHFINDKSSL